MRKPDTLPEYRGRNQMTLQEFIDDVEACHFRSGHDTGANRNAMFVWNILRNWAGMDSLEMDDLIQRHADTLGWTFEDMKADYDAMDKARRNYDKTGRWEFE